MWRGLSISAFVIFVNWALSWKIVCIVIKFCISQNLLGAAIYHQNPTMEQLDYQDGSMVLSSTSPYSALMQYPTFPGNDVLWSSLEPAFLSAFGYAPPTGMMTAQQLQSQFYFPSTDMIWSQDPQMMSYLAVDQQQMAQSSLGLNGTVATTVDPAALGQTFSTMTLNGSGPGVTPAGQPPLPAVLNVSESVETPSQPQTAGTLAGQGQGAPQPEKPKSWAAIASQPAKPKPPPVKVVLPEPPVAEATKKAPSLRSNSGQQKGSSAAATRGTGQADSTPVVAGTSTSTGARRSAQLPSTAPKPRVHCGVVEQLKVQNKYNPTELVINLTNARYFVIKSYAEDDIHRSIKYNIWTSTEHGNRRLDNAFQEQKGKGSIYLFFSVNGSGHFCGMAQMVSQVDFNNVTGVWTQDKWKGRFDVKWIYVKDVPNSQLRHIRLENNENKPVTNSRDTQEVPSEKGKQVVKIFHNYHHTTSIFDDFEHYEKKEEQGGGFEKEVNT